MTTSALAVTSLSLAAAAERVAAADLGHAPPAPVFNAYTPLPAVDGINGAFKLFAGAADGAIDNDRGLFGGTGILSLPLGPNFGTQIEGTVVSHGGDAYFSIADHLFWRDPTRGLVGLYGSASAYNRLDDVHSWRIGGEGEAYWDRFTLRGVAGIEGGDKGRIDDGVNVTWFDQKSRFFDMIDLVYYASDNWNIFAGHRYVGGNNALALGTEYLFQSGGGTAFGLFAEGRIGEDDYRAIWAGVKIHFGTKDKSLIRRDREDDPNSWEPDTLFGIANSINRTPSAPPVPVE